MSADNERDTEPVVSSGRSDEVPPLLTDMGVNPRKLAAWLVCAALAWGLIWLIWRLGVFLWELIF